MRKRITRGILVTLVLCTFFLIAVGSGSAENNEQKELTQEQVEKEEKKETETTVEQKPEKVTIEEQVLLEEDGLRITAKELTDSIMGKGVKLLIENDGSKDVGIGVDALIVNNYMITDLFSTTVAAGKKANETLELYSSQLEAAGIENIGQIEIYMHTFDPETYMTETKFDKITIQTSAFPQMDVVAMDDGIELLNQDGVRIVGKYVNDDSFWGKAILLYLENNTGKNIGVTCDDMSINGFMVTPVFSATIYDGKMSIDEITLFSSELEENGITEVEEVELKFRIYDADSYNTIFETDPIIFQTK